MPLLNLGCGLTRPKGDWINVDNLHPDFPGGTIERAQLDEEHNYLNADITQRLPFDDNSADGCLLSHVLEHFDAQAGLALLQECHRVLRPGCAVLVSVPDTTYFRRVFPHDKNANWPELFEVRDSENPVPTFFEAALWFSQHKVLFTADVLWAYLTRAGFSVVQEPAPQAANISEMWKVINRVKFSLIMAGIK